MSNQTQSQSIKTTPVNNTGLNLQYINMQIPYWASYSILMTFASVFLLSRGFTDGQIGITLALANLLAVILQPYVASFADRQQKITLSMIAAVSGVIIAVMAVLLLILPEIFLITAVLYMFMLTTLMVLQPLTISLGTFFISRGYPLNFGIARGIGSLSFAAASSIAGWCADHFHANSLLFLILIVYTWFVLAVLWLDTRKKGGRYSDFCIASANQTNTDEDTETPCSITEFFKKYRRFMIMLGGVSLLFAFHNMLNSYLYQIMNPLGGTASDVGLSFSIAAITELPTMFLFSKVLKHTKCHVLIKVAAVFFSVKAILILMASNIWIINLAQCTQMLAFALHTAASVYYTNEHIPKKDLVKGQAMMTTANTVGGVFGNFFGGQLISLGGVHTMLLVGTIMSVIGTVIVLLFSDDAASTQHKAT